MGAHVLVIEDNAANLNLLMFLLRAFGHEPVAAEDGYAALECARQRRPDLILCDLQLPVMDGYELVAKFRNMPRLRGVPLIAVTAFVMPGDHERAVGAGCDGYIPKPIDPETFISLIERYLPAEKRSPRHDALSHHHAISHHGLGPRRDILTC
jgi:CheY-like chemotaxis protein